MLGIVLVLIILWKTKTLTQQRVIIVCAACAYSFTLLQEYGLGERNLLEATAIQGTIWFVVFCFVSWLIFRKRIQKPVEPEDDSDEPNDG